MINQNLRLGLVGYGEVGRIFGAGLLGQPQVVAVSAWDLKFAQPESGPRERAQAGRAGVQACDSARELCQASDLVISAVTASSTLAVATEAARHLRPGALYLDLNSASPGTKRECARHVDGAGAHYVEAGVMTSVPPYGIRVPMLLGGAHAADLAVRLRTSYGMARSANARVPRC